MNNREKFKLKIYQSDGYQYQQLFNQVMTHLVYEFKKVKPHGNIGDRGNDGWIPSTGTYYQVYAPDELFQNTPNAIKKVKSDFKTLKSYWDSISPIRSFYFVVNDKFHGISPHISKTLSEIKNDNNLELADVFSTSDLEHHLFSLSHDNICEILGVISHQADPVYNDRKKARDFLDKLSFVFKELFSLRSEAGYFFPSNVFYFIPEFVNNDWELKRLISNNPIISHHQYNIKNQLIKMHHQISQDGFYDDIGLSLKYKPPYELINRNELIDQRRDSMERFINDLAASYVIIRDYSA